MGQDVKRYRCKCGQAINETDILKANLTTLCSGCGKIKLINLDLSESHIQIKIIQWAKKQRINCPDIRWLHHIPNGGARNIAVASKLKLEGVESGIWDLFLPVPRWNKYGLYIEVKTLHGSLSQNQVEFRDFVKKQGYATAVAKSVSEGVKWLSKYLKL